MGDYTKDYGVPLGFGMALAQNTEALERFAAMTEIEKKAVVEGSHNVRSKQEMQSYVNGIRSWTM